MNFLPKNPLFLACVRLCSLGLCVLVLCLLLPGLLGCGGSGTARRPTIGAPAPEFSLPALDGTRLDSVSFGDKVIVLNFWATWCQPCQREIPELVALARDERLEVVGIALDEGGREAVLPFVERHGISYPVLLGNPQVFQEWGGFTIPYTLVLDGSRRVVNVYRGPITRQDVARDLLILDAQTADSGRHKESTT